MGFQIAFNVLIFPHFMMKLPNGTNAEVLDLKFGFSAKEAHRIIGSYTDEGRQNALFIGSVVDTIYPDVYSLLLILALSYFFGQLYPIGNGWRRLNLLPILVLIFDLCENRGLAQIINAFPAENLNAAWFASGCNVIKWSLALVVLAIVFFGMVKVWIFKLRDSN